MDPREPMSIWHKADDFDIDYTAQEVDFLLSPDYQGNVYLSVSFDQIKCIYERILEKEKSGPAFRSHRIVGRTDK